MNGSGDTPKKKPSETVRTPCAAIQETLFDYMARELGPAQSDLVREHVRRCPECQKVAADIQSTLDLLRRASHAPFDAPTRLSEKRRQRLWRALMHPILNWIYTHHVLVSLITSLIAILVILALLEKLGTHDWETPKPGPTITIGVGDPATFRAPPPLPRPKRRPGPQP